MVDPFNLPDTYPDAHGKRKKSSTKKDAQGKGTSEPQKKKKKVAIFLDEDGVPLSERQKVMIMKDTSGVSQQSSKASDAPIFGKSPMAKTLFISDTNISGSVLPTPPPSPSHNTFTIPNSIILYQQQQQQKPQKPPHPPILSSPIPPPFQDVFVSQTIKSK